MSLSRSSAILTTTAEVVALTGHQDLGNLEADSEWSATTALLRAHEWVFDRLEQRFGPTDVVKITNTTRLERAVAYRFLEELYATTLGDPDARDHYQAKAAEEVALFAPVFSDATDVPRGVGEGLPSFGNFEDGFAFGGGGRTRKQDVFSDWQADPR